MVAQIAGSESGVIGRMLVSLAVVTCMAIGLRAAAAAPGLVASVAMLVSLVALAIGLFSHGGSHTRRWRRSWTLLAGALVVQTVVTTQHAVTGLPRTFPVAGDWVGVIGECAVLLALCGLLSMRARGCAADALLQGAIGVSVVLYPVWVWAVMRGVSPRSAGGALVPVAMWLIALWLLLRLVFLTSGHSVAYRYLGVAFLCLAFADAMYAGATLGGSQLDRSRVLGIVLWAYCAWGAAALHPSLRKTFEPVQPRVPRFGPPTVLLCVAAALSGPVGLACFASGHDLRGLTGVVAGAAVAPALLALYLVRQVRNRARAEYRAQHDPLTGLPNQTLFHDRLDVALAHSRRYATGLAVMFLDLDRFKSINDSLGHAVGNQLLQAVANRLRETLRETDTVARMGGDEFTILLHNVNDRNGATATADKIVEQFSLPFVAGGRELHATASIGIAMYPEDGADGDSLLKHADSAMYRAKSRGRDGFEFYTEDLSTRAQARLSVESALRHAIDRRELELHYQPQVNVRTGAIVGLEALARWPHRRFGMIMPNVFIPVAEETGLIATMGDWALDEACAQLRRWINAGLAPRTVAVNVSARQLAGSTLVARVTTALERHDISPRFLELEITESVFMRDLATSTSTISQLRELGVACSIDDFGTGFSGLSYLADLPIDSLKIDQRFVSRIRRFYDDAPIIDAIIGMARALRINVIAEGVETADQARFLADHGCNDVQGYLFSPPRPADDIAQLLAADDQHALESFTMYGGDLGRSGDLASAPAPQPIAASEASVLLAALCAGQMPADRHDEIVQLLAALVPVEARIATPSPLRTASMRVAIGSFAGLMPITAGLAAANALPAPLQSAVAAAFNTAGINVPGHAPGTPGDNGTLLADGSHGGEHADGAVPTGSSEPFGSDGIFDGEPQHHGGPRAHNTPGKEANHSHTAPSHTGEARDGQGNDSGGGHAGGDRGSDGKGNGNTDPGNGGNAGQGNGGQDSSNPDPGSGGQTNVGNGDQGNGGNAGQGNGGNAGNGNGGQGNGGQTNVGNGGQGNGGNAGQGNGGNAGKGNGGQGNGGQGNGGNAGHGGQGTGGQGNAGQGNGNGNAGQGNGGNAGQGNGGQGNGGQGNGGQGNGGQGNGGQGNGNGNGGQGNGKGNGGNAGQGNGGQGNGGNAGQGNVGQGNGGQGSGGNAGQGNGGQGNGGNAGQGNGGQGNGGNAGQGNGGNAGQGNGNADPGNGNQGAGDGNGNGGQGNGNGNGNANPGNGNSA